jgi:hypothetical protein
MKASNSSKKLSKVFAPALLLTAMLAPIPARAANDGGFATDGYLSDTRNGDCMALREHDGRVRYVTGDIDGLRSGDHVRLYGYSIDGRVCGVRGDAYQVSQIQTLWGDERHRTTYYDHLRDGSFRSYVYRQSDRTGWSHGRFGGRGDRNGRDNRWDNNRRDRDLVSLRGRLNDDRRSCPTLETQDGQIYNLVGDLRSFRDNAWARVTAWTGARSECGGPTLNVREISRY